VTPPILSGIARRSLMGDEGMRRSPLLAVPAAFKVLGGLGGAVGKLGKGFSRQRRAISNGTRRPTGSRVRRVVATPSPITRLRPSREQVRSMLAAARMRRAQRGSTRGLASTKSRLRSLLAQRLR